MERKSWEEWIGKIVLLTFLIVITILLFQYDFLYSAVCYRDWYGWIVCYDYNPFTRTEYLAAWKNGIGAAGGGAIGWGVTRRPIGVVVFAGAGWMVVNFF